MTKLDAENEKTKRVKSIRCVVTSDKMNKSRVGTLDRMTRFPKINKYLRRSTKIMFHDEKNECHTGDLVELSPCRPLSAHKSYQLVKIIKKNEEAEVNV